MKIHFIDPRVALEDMERGECGIFISEFGNNVAQNWSSVTCKKCLRRKDAFEKFFAESEAHIIKQMGEQADMVAFGDAVMEFKNICPDAFQKLVDDGVIGKNQLLYKRNYNMGK